jgi:hypothetical protein
LHGQYVADFSILLSVKKLREKMNRLKQGSGSKLRHLSNEYIGGTAKGVVTVKWSMCLLGSVLPKFL